MPRLHLGIVLHNHQPVGNYGSVIEQVYVQAYAPMLAALERHPGIRIAMHNSGCLFDWIAAYRPDYIARLRALCDRGQVEMVTGGYYEPILPMIPDIDKRGQIAKLTSFIERQFGQTPDGLWLTERVWEPGLPAPFADAGVRWTLVDDAHFRMSGMRDDQLDGYYVTEDQGKRVRLFAGSQRLRYIIPWRDVDDVIAELRHVAGSSTRDAPYIVLGDDGEKFGAWPTTYDHVWEKGWIERFFTALEANADWIEMTTPGEYARRFEARGLTYLPAASYAEMMEWAMPAESAAEYHRLAQQVDADGRDDLLRYMRGGFWRYFLAKYPEANTMHKRGLRIDAKLARHEDETARAALWRAQCNCPYWHGVFGGLYLRHIRAATNRNLVEAERLADAATADSPAVAVSTDDFDFDGRAEILVQSRSISLLLHPSLGGMLSEFDLRARDHALLDVLTRRREAYHTALLDGSTQRQATEATNIHGSVRVKEEGLAETLIFDRFRRCGLQEWILAPDATVGQFARNAAALSFEPDGAWQHDIRQDADGASVHLSREASAWLVEKTISLHGDSERITVQYTCTNTGSEHRSALFVSEWNLAPPQAVEGDDRIAILESDGCSLDITAAPPGVLRDVRRFTLRGSAAYRLRCDATAPVDVWHHRVDSISSSEGGVERVMQGVTIALARRLDLAPAESASFELSWSAEDDPAGPAATAVTTATPVP